MSNTSQVAVGRMLRKGIKVLAFDFDETILTIHTGGYWCEGGDRLAKHVRPSMIKLIAEAQECGLHVCVVTFSSQDSLIREVLEQTLPRKCKTSKILIRGTSYPPTWPRVEGVPSIGKLQHIASVVAELSNTLKTSIEPEEVLLLDDDERNVITAREFGHKAYIVSKGFTLETFCEFLNQIDQCSFPTKNV
ncbi:uncharacterized protein LOC102809093 [Saccoglossus kowalevskii]|uniref:Uncharacterized protein LOC102809093 n=1 Tax=Saccoglossus kowalevskii TaxID=10224 RepID=A0ABM0MF80_SACKO|nr:PREDICTED: uncharacterized protein LOC102809093 [Saccoglossus kowalevskii]